MNLKVFHSDLFENIQGIPVEEHQNAQVMLDVYVAGWRNEYDGPFSKLQPKDLEAGRAILKASATQQAAVALATLSLLAQTFYSDPVRDAAVRALLANLFRRNLQYDDQTVEKLLAIASQCLTWELPVGSVVGAVAKHVKANGLSVGIRNGLEKLQGKYNSGATHADMRKIGTRIEDILATADGVDEADAACSFDFNTGEAWTDALVVELGQLDDPSRAKWQCLFTHCKTAKTSKPSKKWLKSARLLVDEIPEPQFVDLLCGTLAAIGKAGAPQKVIEGGWIHYSDPTEIHTTYADMLRGLVWSSSLLDHEDLINAVGNAAEKCFQKVPDVGPRSPKIGNACLIALSSISSLYAVSQLGRLKSRARHVSTRKQIARALERAAINAGMTETDLEEIAVPTFGLQEIGRFHEVLGEFTAEVNVRSHGKSELAWIKENGKRQKSVPSSVKTEFNDELKALKKRIKDSDSLMPSIRFRVEGLFLNERTWSLKDFRHRFLDHPLVGVIARRLIWNFQNIESIATAIWSGDQFIDAGGESVDWIDDETRVTIWHPLHVEAQDVLRWRERLEQLEIVQPFKQAHREIYLLTDAERETAHYSNRFAAHFMRHHQFAALCQQRGWRYRLQGDFDSANTPYLELPQYGLRAEFEVNPVEGLELTESFMYTYVSSDQVRFSGLDSFLPVPLQEIPLGIFSEVMRDVDMFVGVASVGNDPDWSDGGMAGMGDDWREFAFGELSQSASTRKEVLERVIPRLRIASQCSFSDRFLVVEGKQKAYKIHLGSGNVLMLPNDQYLCIVPQRGGGTKRTDNIYLPFEGDSMLSGILSKAFLLADDDKITDASIKHQIGCR